jgi:HAD superfamily hydrolase (TIGR01490 family)
MTVATNLCLFDLDGTLLPIDSDHAFGEFLVSIGWADAEFFRERNDGFFRDYEAGTLDVDAYVDFATSAWRHRAPDEIAAVQQRYLAEVVHAQVRPEAQALVRSHQARGDLVAIVTATNEFVTAPIAQAFGVDNLLAVRLERDGEGRCTGRITGTPTFKEGKVSRVHDWLAGLGRRLGDFERISVYSDSTNDLPLLALGNDVVATNPSPALAAIAAERGWRILHLFQ